LVLPDSLLFEDGKCEEVTSLYRLARYVSWPESGDHDRRSMLDCEGCWSRKPVWIIVREGGHRELNLGTYIAPDVLEQLGERGGRVSSTRKVEQAQDRRRESAVGDDIRCRELSWYHGRHAFSL
jgi:hypothetical protein